jgi:UDP-N-acetylmuramoylalanine--D-glutamate ligase
MPRRGQRASDVAILNRDDPAIWDFREATAARVVPFGTRHEGGDGAWLSDERLHWRLGDTQWSAPRASLRLPGEHNAINALAAGLAALVRGAPFAAVEEGLAQFAGVKDRLESLGEVGGVEYINDTTATAPAAAAAALRAMTRPTVLIAGGSEKHTDFTEFAAVAARVPKAIVLLGGDSLERLTRALLDAGLDPARLHRAAGSMDEAVRWARDLAAPGDVVLLSPACASFGMFRNEFHRGDMFRAAVAGLED